MCTTLNFRASCLPIAEAFPWENTLNRLNYVLSSGWPYRKVYSPFSNIYYHVCFLKVHFVITDHYQIISKNCDDHLYLCAVLARVPSFIRVSCHSALSVILKFVVSFSFIKNFLTLIVIISRSEEFHFGDSLMLFHATLYLEGVY